MVSINSGLFIKSISAFLAFVDSKTEVIISQINSGIVLYRDTDLFFKLPTIESCQALPTKFIVSAADLKPISTLKASIVEENINLTFSETHLLLESNITFNIPLRREEIGTPNTWEVGELEYQNTEDIKVLSRYLGKFSKDNFKGCFLCGESGFIIPGLFHLSHIPTSVPTDYQTFSLKSAQLNKLVKLGQDLSFSTGGRISSNEDVAFFIKLGKAPKESLIATKLVELESSFTEALPTLKILEPKTFKTFLKNTKSEDKQYDLCSLRTEENRLVINFYKDKQQSNSFVYHQLEVPDCSVEIHLQTKHLLAMADLAKNKIEIKFSSNFEPLKIIIDEKYTTYLMQGIVI